MKKEKQGVENYARNFDIPASKIGVGVEYAKPKTKGGKKKA